MQLKNTATTNWNYDNNLIFNNCKLILLKRKKENKMKEFPKITREEFRTRLNNFKKIMEKEKIDLIVIYSNQLDPGSVRYFSNFYPINENGAMVITLHGDPILCSGQACHEWSRHTSVIEDIRIMPEVGEVSEIEYDVKGQIDFLDLFKEIKQKHQIKKIGIIGRYIFPNVIYKKLEITFPDIDIINADKLIFELRISKSPNELECIRKAGEIMSETYQFTEANIKPGTTELEISADIRSQILRLGAEGNAVSWDPMIQSGKENSNLCMNLATRRAVSEGEIIMLQSGCVYEGYNAAISTPVVLGKIPPDIMDSVKILFDAVKIVEGLMKPGSNSVQIFKGYNSFLEEKGYGKYTPYGPIHSIGMLECEIPFFYTTKKVALVENMTIAIDAYLKDLSWGSFRIENTYIINKNGAENVTVFNDKFIHELIL